MPPEKRLAVRNALFRPPGTDRRVHKENPAGLPADELEIVAAWKHAVVGKFYVFRYLTKYTVFLSSGGSPNKAFGVLGLADPLEEVISPYLPRLIETVLLPFRGKIIYDGLVSGFNITFGGGVKQMLNEEYKQAKEAFGIITSLPYEGEEPDTTEEDEAVIVTYPSSGETREVRIGSKKEPAFPLRLTQAQRQVVADLFSEYAHRLQLDEPDQRTPRFTLDELRQILVQCRRAFSKAKTGAKKTSMRHVIDLTDKAVRKCQKEGSTVSIPVSERVFQFKITLKQIKPPIWRRIQVKDCTLDELHEHIQTAMGWTNSHLHQFKIGGVIYGDPELLCEGFGEDPIVNSPQTKVSKIVPKGGKRFQFDYEYDFGDGWEHEIMFEGCLQAEKETRYPICLEGGRACPPEDVGGTYGYQEYLEALADPKHEQHKEFMEWSGRFNPREVRCQGCDEEDAAGFTELAGDGVRMTTINHVLFLCSGNYYRSRFAEHFFNWLAERNGLHWRAESRGLAVGRAGNIGPISSDVIERLHALNVPINGDSRFPKQLSEADLAKSDLIVGLKEAEHRRLLADLFPPWAERVEYWHVDDLDCARPEETLANLENKVRALVARLAS